MSTPDDDAVDPVPSHDLPVPTVAAINLKLPPFWSSNPEVWFQQVDAQFRTRGITAQRTKFDYIVASLSPEFATEVRDLIIHPPTATPYDVLREQLIKRTTASEQRKLQQLFSVEELGDRKPTQLLRRIQQLLGDRASTADSTLLRELFLQRLPGNVRMILAATSCSLNELAELADKVMDAAAPSVSAFQAQPPPPPPQLTTEVDQLRTEVSRLQELVKSLAVQQHPHLPTRRPDTPRRSRSPSPSCATESTCWYHLKYGASARKCKLPCDKSNTLAPR